MDNKETQKIIKTYQKDINEIINTIKSNYKKVDAKKVQKAYEFAVNYHGEQKRLSGEPFVMHPIAVAKIIAEMKLDEECVIAGLLHDTIEDTEADYAEIVKNFSKPVADMVQGVTKLGNLKFNSKQEEEVENYRKMFLAMAKDIRVILIKLADRVHNMRTLNFMPRQKQLKKSKETLEIYAPIANRLGISKIKGELEDTSFKYLQPKQYHAIVVGLDKKREERELYLKDITKVIGDTIRKHGIKIEITSRAKKIYSIFKKMERDGATLNQIFDIFALRIITDTVADCYTCLGIIHEMYRPMPGRFKDYIAVPKENMYQSIHTTLIGKNAPPFEVQIRTHEMNEIAENGIAAHWAYKESNYKSKGKTVVKAKQDKLSWLKKALEWQEDTKNPEEFMEALKIDLFEDEVHIFTPKGAIKSFPQGAIPIDFAYSIHGEIGNRMVGCKINGRMMPIDTELKTGDIVEILTSDNSKGPSRDWIKKVKTPMARTRIIQWYKRKNKGENIEKGTQALEAEVTKLNLKPKEVLTKDRLAKIADNLKYANIDDMLATIGFGTISPKRILTKILEDYKKEKNITDLETRIKQLTSADEQPKTRLSNKKDTDIIVEGLDNFLVNIAKCCSPLPGDEIVGYVTKGRGVTIHRENCKNILKKDTDKGRLVKVRWENKVNQKYLVDVEVLALDRVNLLGDCIKQIEHYKIPIISIKANSNKQDVVVIQARIEIGTNEELASLMTTLNSVRNVFEVRRMKK